MNTQTNAPLVTDWFEDGPNIGAPTNEPGLREILIAYYRPHFSPEKTHELVDSYLAALSRKQVGGVSEADLAVKPLDVRLYNLHVEALAEIKATVDGGSDQPVRDIIYGLLDEISALATETPPAGEPDQTIGEALEIHHEHNKSHPAQPEAEGLTRLRVDARCSTDSVMRHHAYAAMVEDVDGDYTYFSDAERVIAEKDGEIERQRKAGYCDAKWLSEGPPFKCGWQRRTDKAEARAAALEKALKQSTGLLADLDQGRSIHNSRFPDQNIDGPLWAQVSRVVREARLALSQNGEDK